MRIVRRPGAQYSVGRASSRAAVSPAREGATLLADDQYSGPSENWWTHQGFAMMFGAATAASSIQQAAFPSRDTAHRPARAPVEAGHPIPRFRILRAGYGGDFFTAAVTCLAYLLPKLGGARRRVRRPFLPLPEAQTLILLMRENRAVRDSVLRLVGDTECGNGG